MECKFWVGQKVVFTGHSTAKESLGSGGETWPKIKEVYTIRDIEDYGIRYGVGLRLSEIVNAPKLYSTGFAECSFHHSAFRPATDISTFQNIVAKVMNRKKVRA